MTDSHNDEATNHGAHSHADGVQLADLDAFKRLPVSERVRIVNALMARTEAFLGAGFGDVSAVYDLQIIHTLNRVSPYKQRILQLLPSQAPTGAGGHTVIVDALVQPLTSQGILKEIVPDPSNCAFADEKTVSATAFPEAETDGRSASEVSLDRLESCSFTSANSASSHSAFRPVAWAAFAIILAMIISMARRWPRRFSMNSSLVRFLDKRTMDDGGWHGNVPPDSFTVRSPENANAGDAA